MPDKAVYVSQCNHFICQRQTNTRCSSIQRPFATWNGVEFKQYNSIPSEIQSPTKKKHIQSATTEKNAIKLKLIEIKITFYMHWKAAVQFTRIFHLLPRNLHVKCLFDDNKSHFGHSFFHSVIGFLDEHFFLLVRMLLTYQRWSYALVSMHIANV